MHSWDYSGPYHGYDGFAIFARDMDYRPVQPGVEKLTPPWKTAPASAEEKSRLIFAPPTFSAFATDEWRRSKNQMQTVDKIKPCYPLFGDDD